jgi:hypothetical protein
VPSFWRHWMRGKSRSVRQALRRESLDVSARLGYPDNSTSRYPEMTSAALLSPHGRVNRDGPVPESPSTPARTIVRNKTQRNRFSAAAWTLESRAPRRRGVTHQVDNARRRIIRRVRHPFRPNRRLATIELLANPTKKARNHVEGLRVHTSSAQSSRGSTSPLPT